MHLCFACWSCSAGEWLITFSLLGPGYISGPECLNAVMLYLQGQAICPLSLQFQEAVPTLCSAQFPWARKTAETCLSPLWLELKQGFAEEMAF